MRDCCGADCCVGVLGWTLRIVRNVDKSDSFSLFAVAFRPCAVQTLQGSSKQPDVLLEHLCCQIRSGELCS
jgi:hypothetical protein